MAAAFAVLSLPVVTNLGTVSAATVGIDFVHGDFLDNTGIQLSENTATLNAAANLSSPTWQNIAINGAGAIANGSGSLTFAGISVSAFSANAWAAGSESLSGDNDASQQVFRVYLDDGEGGNSYFNGDSIGASIHITGIQSFLTSVGASDYRLTVFYSSDSAGNTFPGATVRQGTPAAPSATAISDLPLLGLTNVSFLGNGQAPNPAAGGSTEGARAWGELSGLTSSDITISLPNGTGGNRASIAGFAITAVPEPTTAVLGGLGLLAVLRRRRRC